MILAWKPFNEVIKDDLWMSDDGKYLIMGTGFWEALLCNCWDDEALDDCRIHATPWTCGDCGTEWEAAFQWCPNCSPEEQDFYARFKLGEFG